jgi:Uma2 family endonuclease
VVQPDILVVCDASKLDERGCRGAPDWIIEVLSPATAAKDQIEKLELYEKHGVREYWLVHPTDRVLSVYRVGPDGRFGRAGVSETKGTHLSSLFDGLENDWDRVFARL